MKTLILILLTVAVIVAIVLTIVWRRTDWEAVDRANQKFIDEHGDHAYYDKDKYRQR